MSEDQSEPIKRMQDLLSQIKERGIREALNFDPENANDVAELGAMQANLMMTEMLIDLRNGGSPEGLMARVIQRAFEDFEGRTRTSWLEGFCDQIQRALEAGMDGKDVGEAMKGNLRL